MTSNKIIIFTYKLHIFVHLTMIQPFDAMGKMKIDTELLKLMDDYTLFLSSEKSMSMPIQITKAKKNHPSSLYHICDIESTKTFGHTSFDCEVREKCTINYSFQILTDSISDRVLIRMDEGNGTHRNNYNDIPLEKQMITTPHFHKYDNRGRFIAYKPDTLQADSNKPIEIQTGFNLFCKEEKIVPNDDSKCHIEVNENGTLKLEYDIDPLNGIKF